MSPQAPTGEPIAAGADQMPPIEVLVTDTVARLTLAAHAPSLGGTETLVSEPRLTSHAAMTAAQRAEAGIPDGFLRFSLGLEDPDDLIADFAQALARL